MAFYNVNVNRPAPEAPDVWLSGFVTMTSALPTVPTGSTAVISVALTLTTRSALAPPIETKPPAWNPVPAIDTASPLRIEPVFGVMPVTTGAGRPNMAPSHGRDIRMASHGTTGHFAIA